MAVKDRWNRLALALGMFLFWLILAISFAQDGEWANRPAENTEAVTWTSDTLAISLFTDYGFAFLAVMVLLASSLAGAVYLARTDDVDEDEIGLEEARLWR